MKISNTNNNKKFPDIAFVKKKKKKYKIFIIKLLNTYHGSNGSSKYWTPIIDIWLDDILFHVHYKIISYKPIYNSKFNIKKINYFLKEPADVRLALAEKKINFYLNYLIKNLINKKKINNNILFDAKFFEKKRCYAINCIYISLIRRLISFYIFLTKPIVIINGYFGYKNAIKIFIYSLGKIIILNQKYILNKNIGKNFVDINYRNKINFTSRKDLFDEIFNCLLKILLPMSFLENYIQIKKYTQFYSNNISKLGTANLHLHDGQFKILLSEFLKKDKPFFVFQHGAWWNVCNYFKYSNFEKKISTKCYYWNNKLGLGFNYLSRFRKIKNRELFKNKNIVYFGAQGRLEGLHDMLVPFKIYHKGYDYKPYRFYKILDKNLKSYFKYRPLGYKKNNINIISKMKKISNIDTNSSLNKTIYSSRVVITDLFSTTFYECIYIGVPIIVIADINSFNLKKSYINILFQLMNKKMIFNTPDEAAIFLNKNYTNLAYWWNHVYNSNAMTKLKNFLYTEENNFCKKIVFELKK
jgi:putative transferase (TIGR04331 family)